MLIRDLFLLPYLVLFG